MTSTSTTMTTSVAATVVIAGLILAPAIAAAQQPAQGQSSQVPIQLALAEKEDESASSEMRARLARMTEQAPNISLIVYPALINQIKKRDFVPGVAEVMALFFERAGVKKKIDVSEDLFRPSDPDDVWKIAREFGRFVRDKRVEADYAVFAEFIGTPQTGPDKIFTVVVDKAGALVWVDTQVRTDPLVKSIKKHTPLTVGYVSVEKLRRRLNLTDPTSKDSVNGKWSKHFDEKAKKRAAGQRNAPKK
ncbi:MAG: hypothetical protein H8E44_39330 [Planctomycetes bacterium]|nr:hypothetical protein [Planctomycetota bacterium]MBL7043983.1 hypothetical protein [Pirellulaceae bacterium]